MRRLLLVGLMMLTSLSLIGTEQIMTVSEQNLARLKTKLEISLWTLKHLNEQTASLEKTLAEAENSRENSAKRIIALTELLSRALKQRVESERIVKELKERSAKLSRLLKKSNEMVNESETRHLKKMQELGAKYENKIKRTRILNYILAGVATAAVVWGVTR